MTPPPNQSARATQLNRMPVHPMNHASKKGPPYPYRPRVMPSAFVLEWVMVGHSERGMRGLG